MKLTLAFLLLVLLNVSAREGYAQKVSIHTRNATLSSVFNDIKEQTGYTVFCKSEYLEKAKPVTLSLRDVQLEDALREILEGQNLEWLIKDNTILVRERERRITDKIKDFFTDGSGEVGAKQQPITGRVLSESGEPLRGATITVKSGKSTDAIYRVSTDRDGRFTLRDVPAGAELSISYVGYQTLTVSAAANLDNLMLKASSAELEEAVAKGYYTTTKEYNTGSVSSITEVDIAKQPVSDPLAALSGRIPGLYVQQLNGVPGSQFTVRLRGRNSLNGNDPLYIVDGVPFNSDFMNSTVFPSGGGERTSPLNSISPSDIVSIVVLKDADATAIYGSRGANGVILITTKKGRSDKAELTAQVYSGIGQVSRKLELMNTQQYLKMRRDAFAFAGRTPGASDYDLNGTWDTTRYTDWQDYFLGGTAEQLDAQTSLSGGNANSKYRISFGYRNEGTVYPGDFSFNRFNSGVQVNHRSNDQRFQLDFSANYVIGENDLPNGNMAERILLAPNAPALYDEEGNLNWANSTWENPVAFMYRENSTGTGDLLANLVLGYEIWQGLVFKTSLGFNQQRMEQKQINPYSAANPSSPRAPNTLRQMYYAQNKINAWTIEPQFDYGINLDVGRLDALVGMSFQETNKDSFTQNFRGFSSDAMIPNMTSAAEFYVSGSDQSLYRYNAVFGRVGFTLLDRYVLNLTGRRDGSSRFGPGKQFGNFGAIGAAWLFQKEKLIKNNLSFLSSGKLRASYGVTGNDQIGDYQYLSTFASYTNTYLALPGLYANQLTNPDYAWEEIRKLEAAIELGFIKDRILIEFNWYRNRTGNQLVNYALPAITGFPSILANLPAVIQNTGAELSINTENIKKPDFSWSSQFSVTIPRNKLVSFPNIENSSYASQYRIGQPLSIGLRYHLTGYDQEAQSYTFADLNGDGNITSTDDRVPIFVGQRYFGGLSNTVTYKALSVDVFIQYVNQVGVNMIANSLPATFLTYPNQPNYVLEDTYLQPFTVVPVGRANNFISSDYYVRDASFLRLKNVSIACQIPSNWIFNKGASFFFRGQNLWTFTRYKGGDPERLSSTIAMPTLRVFTAGLQIIL